MIDKTKGFLAGLLAGIGGGIIIIQARADLLESFNEANPYILGGVLLLIAWVVAGR